MSNFSGAHQKATLLITKCADNKKNPRILLYISFIFLIFAKNYAN